MIKKWKNSENWIFLFFAEFLHHWKQKWWKMKKWSNNDKKWYLKWLKYEDDKINDKNMMDAMITKMITKWKTTILKISNV